MNRSIPAVLALTALLAACSSKPVAPPVASPPPACTVKTSKLVEFHGVTEDLSGQCVRVRGLSVAGILYENGATYQLWLKDHAKAKSVGLVWASEEPAALKTHPQFIEIVGRVHLCPPDSSCMPSLSIAVDSVRIIPTAMD